jgi:hypothetical protein
MIDELEEALSPTSVLPKNLRISEKDLQKMTVDDVSALSGKISAWREVQKAKTNKDVANNPAMHTFKEYPENNPKGVKWQQIKRPEGYDDEEAEQFVRAATKYEGDLMRHCVGGSGHCDPLLNDEVEIYSLRDAKGEPHVTIEVSTAPSAPNFYFKNKELLESPKFKKAHSYINDSADGQQDYVNRVVYLLESEGLKAGKDFYMPMKGLPSIREIKGKGNGKPSPEYIPFVQDFVKSGEWDEIDDLRNTGLFLTKNAPWRKQFEASGIEVPDYLSEPEYRALNEQYQSKKNNKGIEMKAEGGAVQSPNGFDYESHVNKLMDSHNLSNFDYEGHVNKIMGMAEGGATYNTSPDMSDGGAFIQAPSFKIGGPIPRLTR